MRGKHHFICSTGKKIEVYPTQVPVGGATIQKPHYKVRGYRRATPRLPQGYHRGTTGVPQGYHRGTPGVPQGYQGGTLGTMFGLPV